MAARNNLESLFLHALPLDGSMWDAQRELLPGASHAPTLYSWGDSVEVWAAEALKLVKGDHVIVVGCSIGGSCALEVAALAPDRVAALVLIGAKAAHRPEPALHAAALKILEDKGIEEAWDVYWAPLFSKSATNETIDEARGIALRQSTRDVMRGVTAFHTRPDRRHLLSEFPGSIIVVGGDEDRPEGNAAQAAAAQHGQLHIIAECGHYLPLERPNHLNSILHDVIATGRI